MWRRWGDSGERVYLLPVSLPLPPLLVQVSALLHVAQVEVGFSLRLRHFSPQSLLQDRLLVGQPLAQVSPLEPVQVLHKQRQTGETQDADPVSDTV